MNSTGGGIFCLLRLSLKNMHGAPVICTSPHWVFYGVWVESALWGQLLATLFPLRGPWLPTILLTVSSFRQSLALMACLCPPLRFRCTVPCFPSALHFHCQHLSWPVRVSDWFPWLDGELPEGRSWACLTHHCFPSLTHRSERENTFWLNECSLVGEISIAMEIIQIRKWKIPLDIYLKLINANWQISKVNFSGLNYDCLGGLNIPTLCFTLS